MYIYTLWPCPKEGYADPPALRSGHIYMKDAHSTESNKKSYFRFFQLLFFVLWLILFLVDLCHRPNKKSCSKVFLLNLEEIFAKYAVDANQLGWGPHSLLNPKACVVQGATQTKFVF